MGCIYIIKNTENNKVYIGQTMNPINIRFKQHLKDSSCLNNHLYKAMRKYGKEKFYYEILEDNLPYNLLLEREKYWISFYDSVKNGYNLTYGGEGHLKYGDEELLTLWNSGLTEVEIANKLQCAPSTISIRLDQLGISHDTIINRMKQKAARREYDPVLQFTKDGIFIKEWDTATQIQRETGMGRSNIKACCNGKLKSAYGYIWKRKNGQGPQRKAGG